MEISKLELRLAAHLGSYDQVDIWWNIPNKVFNGLTPKQVLNSVDPSPLYSYVSSLTFDIPYKHYE